MTYRCTVHQTTATVDPTTRSVRIQWPPLSVQHAVNGQCALAIIAYRGLDDPTAPLGLQGTAPCEVMQDG